MTKLKIYTPGTNDSLKLFKPIFDAKLILARAKGILPKEFQGDLERIGVDLTNLAYRLERFLTTTDRTTNPERRKDV